MKLKPFLPTLTAGSGHEARTCLDSTSSSCGADVSTCVWSPHGRKVYVCTHVAAMLTSPRGADDITRAVRLSQRSGGSAPHQLQLIYGFLGSQDRKALYLSRALQIICVRCHQSALMSTANSLAVCSGTHCRGRFSTLYLGHVWPLSNFWQSRRVMLLAGTNY